MGRQRIDSPDVVQQLLAGDDRVRPAGELDERTEQPHREAHDVVAEQHRVSVEVDDQVADDEPTRTPIAHRTAAHDRHHPGSHHRLGRVDLEHVVGTGMQGVHHPRLVGRRCRHNDDPGGHRPPDVAAQPHHVEVVERPVDDDDVGSDVSAS